MEMIGRDRKATLVSLGICMCCLGLLVFGTACPPNGLPECTSNADCDNELYCDGAETCVEGDCVDGTDPCAEGVECDEETDTCAEAGCETDADCAEDEFCDTETGECVVNTNLYETAEFDHDFHQGAFDCALCHHDGAGFDTCDTCHDRDEVVDGIAILQDAMHNVDTGCWQCHDEETPDGLLDCSVCHTALNE